MYPRNFLCEEAKIKQRTPLKKELCEIGEEAIWESRFTSFLFLTFVTSQSTEILIKSNLWFCTYYAFLSCRSTQINLNTQEVTKST